MITYRRELHFVCDNEDYNKDCHKELMLDQLDSTTKRGMFSIAKKAGWTWGYPNGKCYCPSCSTQITLYGVLTEIFPDGNVSTDYGGAVKTRFR